MHILTADWQRAEVLNAKPVPPTRRTASLDFFIVNPEMVRNEVVALQAEFSPVALTWVIRNPEVASDVPLVPAPPAENSITCLLDHSPSALRAMWSFGIMPLFALLTLLDHSRPYLSLAILLYCSINLLFCQHFISLFCNRYGVFKMGGEGAAEGFIAEAVFG